MATQWQADCVLVRANEHIVAQIYKIYKYNILNISVKALLGLLKTMFTILYGWLWVCTQQHQKQHVILFAHSNLKGTERLSYYYMMNAKRMIVV